MKKNIFAALSIFISLLTIIPAKAQNGGEILEKYYKATGLDKIADSMAGNYCFERLDSQGDAVVESRVTISYPGKYRIEVNQGGEKIVMIFNGDSGWAKSSGSPAVELKQDGIRVLKSMYDYFALLMLDDDSLSIEYGGEKDMKGRIFDKLIVTDNTIGTTAPSTFFFFDHSTGLLDHATSEVSADRKKIQMRMTFRNYEQFGDFNIPTEISTFMNDRQEMVIRVMTVTPNYPVNESMFQRP